MHKPATLKTFLKMLMMLRDQPLNDLKGFDSLSEDEQYYIGAMTGDISNSLGEPEIQQIIDRLKIS